MAKWIAELFRSSAREVTERRVGLEVERIGIWLDGTAWSYSSKKHPNGNGLPGAKDLLQNLSKQNGWPLITSEKNCPMGLNLPDGKVSLEPGSQVEFSTDPMQNIFQVQSAIENFESKVPKAIECEKLSWLTIGTNPLNSVSEIELIPSTRYGIMTEYFENRTELGTSMMRRTSSVQINLDYTNEEEAIEMLRVSLALAPISYALFANSPFIDGKESDYLSYRHHIWQKTDPSRTGLFPEAFQPDFNFDSYAASLWNRPLMFAQNRKNLFIPADGKTLKEISEGKLDGAFLSENNKWNAIRELFTEARLKPGYIEIRSLDGLTPEDRYAATAFWLGILYDSEARKLALKLMGNISTQSREVLMEKTAKNGLKAEHEDLNLFSICQNLIEASENTLKLRKQGEENFLLPLWENFNHKMTPADKILKNFHGSWNKNILKVIENCRQKYGC